MRRFFRFSQVSPLELYRESERRAWVSAAFVSPFFFLLVWAASISTAGRPGSAGNTHTDFTGVVVSESKEEGSVPSEPRPKATAHSLLPCFEEEMRIHVPLAVEPDTAQIEEWESEWENEWERDADIAHNPLPEVALPEQLASPAPPRRTASTPTAPAKAGSPGDFIAASYRTTPRPPYPSAMLNRRIEGRVRIKITLNAEGVPQKVEVENSSGYTAFDSCACEWVLTHWRFHPARRQGVAVASVVHTQVEFVLR